MFSPASESLAASGYCLYFSGTKNVFLSYDEQIFKILKSSLPSIKSEWKWNKLFIETLVWCCQTDATKTLPPTGNANGLKTGVKTCQRLFNSESVSKHPESNAAAREKRKTRQRKWGEERVAQCEQQASVIYDLAHECHWWMPINCLARMSLSHARKATRV